MQAGSISPVDYGSQNSPLHSQVYLEGDRQADELSEGRRDVNSYNASKGYPQPGTMRLQDDANYQRTHPVLQNLTNIQSSVAMHDNARLSDSTSISSSNSDASKNDPKQESFLQRATKFFQQQFQLDIKVPSDKTPTSGVPQQHASEEIAKNAIPVNAQMNTEQAPSYPKPSPIVTQHQKGISPYRQMPVVTRDQLAPQQPRAGATQNYLQPPNVRGHRKISDSRLMSQSQGESPGDARRRLSAAGRLNKSPESGSSSPSMSRKQRMLPSTAGRQQIGKKDQPLTRV